jgi:hypothetical protein
VKVQETLRELEEVAHKKSVKVSYENLTGELGAGGLCKVRGEYRIIVDKRANDGDKAAILASGLARLDLDDVFISDATRGFIDRHKKK